MVDSGRVLVHGPAAARKGEEVLAREVVPRLRTGRGERVLHLVRGEPRRRHLRRLALEACGGAALDLPFYAIDRYVEEAYRRLGDRRLASEVERRIVVERAAERAAGLAGGYPGLPPAQGEGRAAGFAAGRVGGHAGLPLPPGAGRGEGRAADADAAPGPWLARGAGKPGFVARLARFLEELREAGIDDGPALLRARAGAGLPVARRDQELAAALDLYAAGLAERRIADRPEAIRAVARAIADRRPVLRRPAASLELLVLDDLYDLTGAERELVAALASRFQRVVALLDAEVDEGAPFPDALGPGAAAARFHVERLGARSEARPAVAATLGARVARRFLRPASGGAARLERDDRALALVRHETAREEVESIARAIRDIARRERGVGRSGADLGRVGVIFPTIETAAPLVREVFPRFGVPFEILRGHALDRSPVVRALVALLEAAAQGFDRASVARALGSPYVRFRTAAGEPLRFERLERLAREAHLSGPLGVDGWRRGLEAHLAILATRLRVPPPDLTPAVTPVPGPHPAPAPFPSPTQNQQKVDSSAPSTSTGSQNQLFVDSGDGLVGDGDLRRRADRRRLASGREIVARDLPGLEEALAFLAPLANGALAPRALAAGAVAVLERFEVLGRALAGEDPEAAARDASAHRALQRALSLLASALEGEAMPLGAFVSALRVAIAGETYVPSEPGETPGRVRVLGRLDARGLPFDHLFLAGLRHDEMPGARAVDIFYDEEERARLGLRTQADHRDEMRALFARHLGSAGRSVRLSYAAEGTDEDHAASPFLHAVERILAPVSVPAPAPAPSLSPSSSLSPSTSPPSPSPSPSPPSLAAGPAPTLATLATLGALHSRAEVAAFLGRALASPEAALAADVREALPALAAHAVGARPAPAPAVAPAAAAGLVRGVLAAVRRADPGRLSGHDGLLEDRAAAVVAAELLREGRPLSPSQLEEYVACPFRYLASRALRIGALPDVDEDRTFVDQGDIVHRALARFYRELAPGRGEAWVVEAAPRLLEIVRDEARRLGREDAFLRGRLRALTAGLDPADAAPAEGPGTLLEWLRREAAREDRLAPALLEERVRLVVEQASGPPLAIEGTADRIDLEPEGGEPRGFLVLDYKTGGCPTPKQLQDGTKLQLPVYTAAAAQRFGPGARPLGGAFVVLKAGEVRHQYLADAAAFGDGRPLGPKSRQHGVREDFPAVLDAVPAAVSAIAAAIRQGLFHPGHLPPREKGCEWCELARVCRVDHGRLETIVGHTAGKAFRPLPIARGPAPGASARARPAGPPSGEGRNEGATGAAAGHEPAARPGRRRRGSRA